jgi:hypothetical protein
MKFCFLETLSIQCELFIGTECQSSFYLSPSRTDFIFVPTEPGQVVTLCHKKHTQKYEYLQLNPPNQCPLSQQGLPWT